MLIIIALAVAGAYGTYRVGRVMEAHASARRATRAEMAELMAFQRMCDDCHVAIGKLSEESTKGDWFDRKVELGCLSYETTHGLPVGRVIAVKLRYGDCRYCGLRLYALFEIAEKEGDKGNFPRILCTICPSLQCGLIERNGAYALSKRYGRLIEAADNAHALLIELLERHRNPPPELLPAPPPAPASLAAGDTDKDRKKDSPDAGAADAAGTFDAASD